MTSRADHVSTGKQFDQSTIAPLDQCFLREIVRVLRINKGASHVYRATWNW